MAHTGPPRVSNTGLELDDPGICEAWERVLSDADPSNWLLLCYDGKSKLKLKACGTGGAKELLDNTSEDDIHFGGLKTPKGEVLGIMCGSATAGTAAMGRANSQKASIFSSLGGITREVTAASKGQMESALQNLGTEAAPQSSMEASSTDARTSKVESSTSRSEEPASNVSTSSTARRSQQSVGRTSFFSRRSSDAPPRKSILESLGEYFSGTSSSKRSEEPAQTAATDEPAPAETAIVTDAEEVPTEGAPKDQPTPTEAATMKEEQETQSIAKEESALAEVATIQEEQEAKTIAKEEHAPAEAGTSKGEQEAKAIAKEEPVAAEAATFKEEQEAQTIAKDEPAPAETATIRGEQEVLALAEGATMKEEQEAQTHANEEPAPAEAAAIREEQEAQTIAKEELAPAEAATIEEEQEAQTITKEEPAPVEVAAKYSEKVQDKEVTIDSIQEQATAEVAAETPQTPRRKSVLDTLQEIIMGNTPPQQTKRTSTPRKSFMQSAQELLFEEPSTTASPRRSVTSSLQIKEELAKSKRLSSGSSRSSQHGEEYCQTTPRSVSIVEEAIQPSAKDIDKVVAETEKRAEKQDAAEAAKKTEQEENARRAAEEEANARRAAEEEENARRAAEEEANARRAAEEEENARRAAEAELARQPTQEEAARQAAEEEAARLAVEKQAARAAAEEWVAQRAAEEQAAAAEQTAKKAANGEMTRNIAQDKQPVVAESRMSGTSGNSPEVPRKSILEQAHQMLFGEAAGPEHDKCSLKASPQQERTTAEDRLVQQAVNQRQSQKWSRSGLCCP